MNEMMQWNNPTGEEQAAFGNTINLGNFNWRLRLKLSHASKNLLTSD
jgi:hypothetical protein